MSTKDLADQHIIDTNQRLSRLQAQRDAAIAGHASYERAYAVSMQVLDEMIAECKATAAHWSDVNKAEFTFTPEQRAQEIEEIEQLRVLGRHETGSRQSKPTLIIDGKIVHNSDNDDIDVTEGGTR